MHVVKREGKGGWGSVICHEFQGKMNSNTYFLALFSCSMKYAHEGGWAWEERRKKERKGGRIVQNTSFSDPLATMVVWC